MIIVNILLGLLGLGIVVVVHELGHFVAAKLSGITVETFSVGWGKKIASVKRGDTEYRISAFPVGGYCKMKGEEILRSAVEEDADRMEDEPGSLFSVSPLKRIFTYLAGPLANILFAIIVLTIVWFAGFTVQTFSNRIILLSETPYATEESYPADAAGFRTGDRIVEINGEEVSSFRDIDTRVTPNPDKSLDVTVERRGQMVELSVVPELDRETGAARIGVAAWVNPVVAAVESESAADNAGVRPGDTIVSIDGREIDNTIDVYDVILDQSGTVPVTVEREGRRVSTELEVVYNENGELRTGISFQSIQIVQRERNIFTAIARGATESVETLLLALKSIGLLFKGVNVGSAVSGPIRITYLVGEVTSQGFGEGLSRGLIVVSRFLSLLSVALGITNLLPIPALDGGMILFITAEGILGRQVRPKVFYRYQLIGFMILLGILVLATFNDVFFLIQQ